MDEHFKSFFEQHKNTKATIRNYKFDILQRDIEFNARTAADSWMKKKKKCQNKIKRLKKEIEDLQESADIFENNENRYRETYNAAVEYREELREMFDEAD